MSDIDERKEECLPISYRDLAFINSQFQLLDGACRLITLPNFAANSTKFQQGHELLTQDNTIHLIDLYQ